MHLVQQALTLEGLPGALGARSLRVSVPRVTSALCTLLNLCILRCAGAWATGGRQQVPGGHCGRWGGEAALLAPIQGSSARDQRCWMQRGRFGPGQWPMRTRIRGPAFGANERPVPPPHDTVQRPPSPLQQRRGCPGVCRRPRPASFPPTRTFAQFRQTRIAHPPTPTQNKATAAAVAPPGSGSNAALAGGRAHAPLGRQVQQRGPAQVPGAAAQHAAPRQRGGQRQVRVGGGGGGSGEAATACRAACPPHLAVLLPALPTNLLRAPPSSQPVPAGQGARAGAPAGAAAAGAPRPPPRLLPPAGVCSGSCVAWGASSRALPSAAAAELVER